MAEAYVKSSVKFPAPPISPFPEVQVHASGRNDHVANLFDLSGQGSGDDDVELLDGNDSFTVDQDLLLVRNWCFQPEMPLEEIAIQFRREFGLQKTAADIERRLSALQSDQLKALLAVYLKALSVRQNTSGGYESNASSLKPPFHALLRRLRPSCETKLLQLVYKDEKALAEMSETIAVDVSSRNFPKYSRLVQRRQLERASNVIRDLFKTADLGSKVSMSANQAFSIHSTSTGPEKLQLTDSVPFYGSCMVFNHLEQPILDCFLQFAKDPNVMVRLLLQKQQLAEQMNIKRELAHKLHHIFVSQQKRQLEKLEEARATERKAIKQHLEKALDEDILHLRRMHEALLKHEHAKINARFDEQIFNMNRLLASMKNEVTALHKTSDAGTWNSLEQDIARSNLNVERIFGTSDYILRLLILAEDLDADPLRRALIQYLSKESVLPQFALRREFSSKMISESTVVEILKGTPTADLRDVEADGKTFVYHHLVVREIHTRRITFSRFIAGLTNDQLRVVSRIKSNGLQSVLVASDDDFITAEMLEEMKAVHDFTDVLDREFARRRDFSSVRMNSSDVDREVSFSEDDCVLELEAAHLYCSVLATKERKQGGSGKWMFEASIEVFAGDGESLLIGWEIPRTHTGRPDRASNVRQDGAVLCPVNDAASAPSSPFAFVPGLTPSADGRNFGVTWQSDGGLEMGMLHANGQSKSGVACFRAGDVVGCTIDQDELIPYLRFYLNGVQVIPALTTAAAGSSPAGVACQNPVYCLFPVVSMYSSRKKPQMRVRFNFRGNFRFPITGFEPYGAPL